MKRLIMKGLTINIIGGVILFASICVFGENQFRLQGLIMGLALEKNMININERTFFLNEKTVFYNENGNNIQADKFKPDSWVYLEAEKEGGRMMIRKIYLLPKRIDHKEQNRYPFIQW